MTTNADDNAERSERGFALRRRREGLNLSRIQLASAAGCGLAQLSAIEGGAVPRKSRVLDDAEQALDRIERDGVIRSAQ